MKYSFANYSLLVLLFLLGACTAPQSRIINENPGDLPIRAAVEDVPFYPQEAYYCGPAALAMTLSWSGVPTTQEEIAKQVYTPGRQGTLPTDILAGARRNGVLAVKVDSLEDLLAEIASGHPVLVLQNLGLKYIPRWHFAVAVEYDLAEDIIVLHSGLNPRRETNLDAFEQTWRRADYWAVTVTKPPQLPTNASVRNILEAATGLERAGQHEAAITAYTAISNRWKNNVTAHIGLGNTFYASGKFEQSVSAYQDAITLDPKNAVAWNNLAYALAKLDRRKESLDAAERAIAIGGENMQMYQQTLQELKQDNH